jgi:hypothetical protein
MTAALVAEYTDSQGCGDLPASDQRAAVLSAGGPQHLDRLAVQQDDRAHVHSQLEVDVLGLVVGGGRPDPDARVVDEHVQAPELLAMARDEARDRLRVREVGGHGLHLTAAFTQALGRLLERVWLAGADGETIALAGQGLGERKPDPATGSGDDGGAVRHERHLITRRPGPGANAIRRRCRIRAVGRGTRAAHAGCRR